MSQLNDINDIRNGVVAAVQLCMEEVLLDIVITSLTH
jgi:hypothetical protein